MISIKFLPVWILLFFSFISSAQVINHYSPVLEFDFCAATAVLEDTSGFSNGLSVILYQAKGADINESNGSSFGTISLINGAGRYEINEIDSIEGQKVYLKFVPQFPYQPSGSVQMISFPSFDTLQISDTLRAKPWDGLSGGILAFKANFLKIENGGIDVSGCGFRGGTSISISNNCIGGLNNATSYFYDANDFRGARKGEGIADFIPGKENGRGAQANGGGGGNDHNSGGAGGGNQTAGGDGGERDTPFFTGSCKGEYPGKGGRAIQPDENQIFLGGGGGAGHGNNDEGTDGGHGGGILIIEATSTNVLNGFIHNSGTDANNTSGGDGAGGGGAGGSILADFGELTGNLSVISIGGNGGNVDNINDDTCFGPGGGGSGGVVSISSSGSGQVMIENQGGNPGLTINSTSSCNNSSNGADAGMAGLELAFEELIMSNEIYEPTSIDSFSASHLKICEGDDLNISTYVSGGRIEYQWQINQGSGYMDLQDGGHVSGAQSSKLEIVSLDESYNDAVIRLVVGDFCGEIYYASDIEVEVFSALQIDFSFAQSGYQVDFDNLSSGADSVVWDFGDGNTSDVENPIHIYTNPGIYTVKLSIFGPCGMKMLSKQIEIQAFPIAEFTSNKRGGCLPFQVSFESINQGSGWNYEWKFPGGNPSVSNLSNPTVSYSNRGQFDVFLKVTNSLGSDSITYQDFITVLGLPIADFQTEVNGLDVDFTFTGQATAWNWEFGDGNSAGVQNPTHSYPSSGTYTVILIVENICGKDTIERTVITGFAPEADGTALNRTGCPPLNVTWTDRSIGIVNSRIWEFEGGVPSVSSDSVVTVRYNQSGLYDTRLIVGNDIGFDTMDFTDFVDVAIKPSAQFDYNALGLTVSFINNSSMANTYRWNFGDGSPLDNSSDPIHTFPAPGQYFVTLEALNSDCSSSITIGVNVRTSAVKNESGKSSWELYPNPFEDYIRINRKDNLIHPQALVFYDMNGKLILSVILSRGQFEISTSGIPSGIYRVDLILESEIQSFRMVKI
jgi:PKD repeat protein